MKLKHLWLVMVFQISVTLALTQDRHLKDFISTVESLVLESTEKALFVTTNAYRNLTKALTPRLKTAIEPLIEEYIEMVRQTKKCHTNYVEKRKLLRYFRNNNQQIERLRMEVEPQQPKFHFHLISKDFYSNGKNSTEFDNIYLDFMQQFQRASQTLWDSLSEEVVEQEQDLLQILDDISNEKELSEKDKLYDEFIEIFLFKTEVDDVQNRELE